MSEPLPQDARLRQHPQDRFAVPQIKIDLPAAIAKLRSEPRAGEHGHRQETLYRRGTSTIALFLFERFTDLREHAAKGTVIIQVLRGCVKITAEDQVHELNAGQMLILAPEIRHAVAAQEESEMLVSINLVGGA